MYVRAFVACVLVRVCLCVFACVCARIYVCVCFCVRPRACVCMNICVRVFGKDFDSQAKEDVSTLNAMLTLIPITRTYCSVQTAVQRSTPIRGQ